MMACHKDSLRVPAVRELIALLQRPEFAAQLAAVPGYAPDAPGTVVPMKEIFAWTGG